MGDTEKEFEFLNKPIANTVCSIDMVAVKIGDTKSIGKIFGVERCQDKDTIINNAIREYDDLFKDFTELKQKFDKLQQNYSEAIEACKFEREQAKRLLDEISIVKIICEAMGESTEGFNDSIMDGIKYMAKIVLSLL